MTAPHAFSNVGEAVAVAAARLEGFSEAAPRAVMLARLAAAIDSSRHAIIRAASEESALTPAELAPEFDRTISTLNLFANVVRDGSWVRAAINPAPGAGQACIGPAHDLRTMLVPLGEVVGVFGASNFPLAYGVLGGDTASALAAGCAVVAKEHPAQPRTGRLLARIAADAGAPFAYLLHENPRDFSIANALVTYPSVCGIGFTGSVEGGLALDAIARQRPTPIPVFAEMGSANPVVITPGAAAAQGRDIGVVIGESIMARHGQQCTKPGLIFAPKDATGLVAALVSIVQRSTTRDMLAPWVRDAYLTRVRACIAARGVSALVPPREPMAPRDGAPSLLRVALAEWTTQPVLHQEIFGPSAIVIEYDDIQAVLAAPIPNALTATLHASLPADLPLAQRLVPFLAPHAGRFIFGGVPTGVRVADAMVHGGPFSATNRPDSTAVGPRAIERWCRPVCFQNLPAELLPAGLRP